MNHDDGGQQAPLIGTLRFVLIMGAVFGLLWLGMFVLMAERW